MSGAHSIPEASAAGLRRSELYVGAKDGTALFRRSWIPEEPRRAILLVHGYAEHCGRYEELATWLATRGAAVHAYDHRGHGRSGGRRSHVRSFDEFLDDLDTVLDCVRSDHASLPLVLVGHSMGALITLAHLTERKPVLSAAVTSGAAVAVDGASPMRIAVARVLSKVWPTLKIGSGLDVDGLSRDPDVVRKYLEDPLVFRHMTVSLGAAMISMAQQTATRGAEVQVPLLMLHGEADPICSVEGTTAFAEAVTTTGSEVKLYPELRHEIFNEPEKEQVYTDMWNWIEGLS